jgi:hypothetical protein
LSGAKKRTFSSMERSSRSSSMDVLSRVGRELQARGTTSANVGHFSLTETLRNDPISRVTMIAGRALNTADRANQGGLGRAISLAEPPPMEEAEAPAVAPPAPPPLPPPQSLPDVLAASRVSAVQFSQRNQALEAQLQRSRQLLAAAAALGQAARPLPAADALAVAQPSPEAVLGPPRAYVDQPPTELAPPARHDAATRLGAAGARSQSHSRPWQELEPEPEPEREPQMHACTESPLGARRSPMRTVSGVSDWRAEFLRELPFLYTTLAAIMNACCCRGSYFCSRGPFFRKSMDRFNAVNRDSTGYVVFVRFGEHSCTSRRTARKCSRRCGAGQAWKRRLRPARQ